MKIRFLASVIAIGMVSIMVSSYMYFDQPKTPWDCREKHGKVAEDIQNCLDDINQKFSVIPQAFGICMENSDWPEAPCYGCPSCYDSDPDEKKAYHDSPLKQIKNGVALFDVTCNDNKIPTYKSDRMFVACVSEETHSKLIDRGWSLMRFVFPGETPANALCNSYEGGKWHPELEGCRGITDFQCSLIGGNFVTVDRICYNGICADKKTDICTVNPVEEKSREKQINSDQVESKTWVSLPVTSCGYPWHESNHEKTEQYYDEYRNIVGYYDSSEPAENDKVMHYVITRYYEEFGIDVDDVRTIHDRSLSGFGEGCNTTVGGTWYVLINDYDLGYFLHNEYEHVGDYFSVSKSEFASMPMENYTKSVIVMVAPSINEEYYQEVFHEIVDYDIKAINTIYGKDDVVLLVDKATKPLFQGKIPDDAILEADVADIWIRDFGTINTKSEVKFDYRPQYLELEDADWIDDSFEEWFDSSGLSSKKTDLVLDGGNFVFNGQDKAVTTVRIFEDNPQYSESEIDSMLKELLQVTEIAYLPEEEGDITGHSDGMVMWAESDKLLVNEYEEPFRSQVLSELEKSFSDIEIVEIPYVLHEELWRDWPSACGYYLNSLVTENYIYVPIYGLKEDQHVLDLIQSHTSKDVIGIDASNVCFMGGSVRCLTWTTDGINAERIFEN